MKTSSLIFFIFIIFASCKTAKTATTTTVTPEEIPVVVDTITKADTVAIATMKKTIVSPMKPGRTDTLLEDLLKSRPLFFNNILNNRDALKIQVVYTAIDRQADNSPVFRNYYFNVNDENYFYPASTVKMPVAVMALQRLNELKVFGLNSNSSMVTEAGYKNLTPVYNDPTTPDGRPSISQYIKKIFLASDNDAFNRLYEFLGQQYINERLHNMGYAKADILHRLAVSLSEDENRHTNPVKFFSETGKSLYTQPMQVSMLNYAPRADSVGNGYYSPGKLVNAPMPFSDKNRLGLEDLAGILKSIMFPGAVPQKQRFNVKPEDYRFLHKYMSQFPGETLYPSFDSVMYWDSSLKFLLFGAEKKPLPGNIRIFNKSGEAYGFLTDIAYIVDFDKKIEFLLSATIYCNSDGILNDDKYDYERIGVPFMKELGRLVYDYESTRERMRQPDLSVFKLVYDK